jgi:hypothetical protein
MSSAWTKFGRNPVPCDVHHGQRNLQVLAASSGSGHIKMIMHHPGTEGPFELVLDMSPVKLRALPRNMIDAIFDTIPVGLLAHKGKLGDFAPRPASSGPANWGFEGEGVKPGRKAKIVLQPGEVLPLTLTVTMRKGAKPGETHVLHTRSTDGAGNVVGGATLLVVAV